MIKTVKVDGTERMGVIKRVRMDGSEGERIKVREGG